MIRVLHYGISQNRGGIETYLYKLWSNIDHSKFHFDFIDTNLDNPCFYDEFNKLGSNFYKITHRNISLIKNRRDLQELFERESFDIFHCHLNTLSYIEPIRTALKYGCKVIVHSRSAGTSNSIITNSLHHFHSLILPRDKIKMVAVSDLAGKWLFGKAANFQTINNGIDIERFQFSIKNRRKLRNELNLKDKFVVGNVGAFLYAKNHKFILKVFYELLKQKPEAVLVLIGTGPMKEDVVNYANEMGIKDNVLFLGRRSDIPALLSAMDFFLFPSLYEGFPNAVLEAQTSGLPSLISDTITNEVEVARNCQRLSLNLSPKEWANNIINLEPYEDRRLGSNQVKSAGFSMQEEIKKVESMYENLLDKR